MKKVVGYFSVTVLFVVGMLGIMAQGAFAIDPQPDCAGLGAGIKKAWVNTDGSMERDSSELLGGALLCGSDLPEYGGDPKEHISGYRRGVITTPELVGPTGNRIGMEFRCANPRFQSACTTSSDIPAESFTGDSVVDISAIFKNGDLYYDFFDSETVSKVYVDHAPGQPDNPRCSAMYREPGQQVMYPVVQCFQGIDMDYSALSTILVTKIRSGTGSGAGTGQYKLHILPATLGELDIFFTKIGKRGLPWNGENGEGDPDDAQGPLHVCEFAGLPPNNDACGTGEPGDDEWLQKNGTAATYDKCLLGQSGAPLPGLSGWVVVGGKNEEWAGKDPYGCANEKWNL